MSDLSPPPRLIAHYLPQFHPTAENDEWWGRGFTEWTNVARAKPLFRGHYQPHLPSDLGFYDLRLSESREAQAELARSYGIHGFMYYHYWFHGRQLLDRPFREVLESGKPDFPFCLCWANESWSRRWLGEEKDVLIAQEYSEADLRAHARWLARAFADSRYIRVHGRPLFVIYRYSAIPKDLDSLGILRDELSNCGAGDPYLVAADGHDPAYDFQAAGFDHAIGFQPAFGAICNAYSDRPSKRRALRNLKYGSVSPTLQIFDYNEAVEIMCQQTIRHKRIPCLLVSWDNSPRRGERAIVFANCSPEAFGAALHRELERWAASKPEVDLFFLNGWNEWAEGNHLEPDQKFGRRYLEALLRVRDDVGSRYGWNGLTAVAPQR